MLKRPQWVKEKIDGREKDIPLQMTVKKRYPMETPYATMPTMGMNTGSGVDGQVQPGKMVDIQVHEGEGIVPNNAMQGITDEEFKGLIETLSTGNIDKNKFREAIGMSTVSEYQTGGRIDRSRGIPAADSGATATTGSTTTTTGNTTAATVADTISVPTQTRDTTAKTATIQVPTTQAVQQETITAPAQQTRKTAAEIAAKATPVFPAVQPATETTPATETQPTSTQTVTKSVVSPAGEAVRVGLQNILAEATGVSDLDRKILDFYLQNIDASNAANMRLLESQISSDSELSEQGKQAAIRGLQREAAAQRSEKVGELAISAAERSSQAARDLVTYGQDVRNYEEITKPKSDLEIQQLESDLGEQNWDEIQSMIDKGMKLTRINEKLAEKGLAPLSQDEYDTMLQAGSLGERNWGRQLSMAETLLATPDPAGNNLGKAAVILSDLYGVDIDFSQLLTEQNAETFSNGLAQMSTYVELNMNTDAALEAMKADGTLAMLGGDEALATKLYNTSRVNSLDQEWKEIESSQYYQDLLNSSDPADQQRATAIKEFNHLAKMGLLDYDTMYEYQVYDGNNVKQGTVYAKTPAEAQAKADENGVGYTVQGTGAFEFVIKQEPTTATSSTSAETETASTDLKDINATTNKELLNTENSDILFNAWKEDPAKVRKSEYYYTIPDSYKGSKPMREAASIMSEINKQVGKFVEIPTDTGTITGQIVGVGQNAQDMNIIIDIGGGVNQTYSIK